MAYDNAKLVELFEKIQRKNHLETVLKELRENIAQLEPEVRGLMTQMYLEQEDVDKIEGNGLKSFFYSLTGRKHDIIDKERQEAYDAKKKYDAANFQLETMKNDLKRYIDEYNEVRYLEPEYEKAIKEKIEYIREIKSPAAKQIAELDKQIDDVMKKNNELRHLRTLANRAIGTAEHMKTVLTQVKKLNTKDMLGMDMASSGQHVAREKYELMSQAETLNNNLFAELYDLEKQTRGVAVKNNITIRTTKIGYIMDWQFDGLGRDLETMSIVNKALKNLDPVIEQVNEFVAPIIEKLSKEEAQQKELYRQRDEIVRNAEV
ncbi:MAG: hypothetical protein E7432_09230 [Ruminococcaceae bacterium]|nr:hypothetical protein [Oscillospiraceae bacterium]